MSDNVLWTFIRRFRSAHYWNSQYVLTVGKYLKYLIDHNVSSRGYGILDDGMKDAYTHC